MDPEKPHMPDVHIVGSPSAHACSELNLKYRSVSSRFGAAPGRGTRCTQVLVTALTVSIMGVPRLSDS